MFLHIQRSSHGVFSTSVGVSAAALASVLWQVKACPFQPVTVPKVSRSFSTKNTQHVFFWTIICYVHHSGSISWYCLWAEKDMLFSSSDCWFFQFQTFRGLGLGVVGSSRFGCERRMDDTKVYKHGRNDAEFCMLNCYIYYQRMSSKHCEFHFFDMLPNKKHIPTPQKKFPIWWFILSTAASPTRWPLLRKKGPKNP